MATGFYRWSKTPATNASVTYNMAEGMAPSQVNDGVRGLMSDAAQWRDDISGAIVTGGSSTAFTVTSYSTFETLALMSGNMVAFTPHVTSGAAPTLNVDSLGAKALRFAPGVDLPTGSLIQGTPYVAVYSNSDAAWYLHCGAGAPNAYSVPLAGGMDYWAATTPSSIFAFPAGQAISRTTYAALYALIGDTYGAGNGSTTFNLPDKRGRVTASLDNMGGSTAGRLTSATITTDATTLGRTGGGETRSLVTANLPAYTPSGSISVSNGAITINGASSYAYTGTSGVGVGGGGSFGVSGFNALSASQGTTTASFSGTAQGGSSTAFGLVQPTILCNAIMRVL